MMNIFGKETYIVRRKALKNKGLKGVGLILGNNESPMNYRDNTYHYRQDSSFLYFFGLNFPGLAGVVDFDSGEDYIFGNDVDIEDIIWMGPQVPLKENASKVGVGKTAPYGSDEHKGGYRPNCRFVSPLRLFRCKSRDSSDRGRETHRGDLVGSNQPGRATGGRRCELCGRPLL